MIGRETKLTLSDASFSEADSRFRVQWK